jgi:hypothetical protein
VLAYSVADVLKGAMKAGAISSLNVQVSESESETAGFKGID